MPNIFLKYSSSASAHTYTWTNVQTSRGTIWKEVVIPTHTRWRMEAFHLSKKNASL